MSRTLHLSSVAASLFLAASLHGAVPELVKDINESATLPVRYPQDLFAAGSTLFFTAEDVTHGRELWKINDTGPGVILVKDISPGISSSMQEDFLTGSPESVAIGGTQYFAANDGVHGTELWRSDGTAAGTVLVKDVYQGKEDSFPWFLKVMGGMLYFTASDGTPGFQLWKSDGTAEGTVLVKTIPSAPPPSTSNGYLRVMGNTLWFVTGDAAGRSLWKTDGTSEGTVLVKFFAADSWTQVNLLDDLTIAGDRLFFTGYDAVHGFEPWSSDGTAEGTAMVKDLNSGDGSHPFYLMPIGPILYFFATSPGPQHGLWRSDGTVNGTWLVRVLSHEYTGGVAVAGNTLYFAARENATGVELWKTEGTAESTLLVRDIHPGTEPSYPNRFRTIGNTLYFTANDGTNGMELWRSDGTTAGTFIVKEILQGPDGARPDQLTKMGNTIFFTADDNTPGGPIWRTDGTEAGTQKVRILNAGTYDSSPASLTAAGGNLYFTAWDFVRGMQMWKTDGTEAGTLPMKDLMPGTNAWANLTDVNGTLFFAAGDSIHGVELWKSDGTGAGTALIIDIKPGTDSSFPEFLTVVGNKLFFTTEGWPGRDLWVSDGSVAATGRLKETTLLEMTRAGGLLYFVSEDLDDGLVLWKTDGTIDGTVKVKTYGSGVNWPSRLTGVNGTLFFAIEQAGGIGGTELWTSDGTGTRAVKAFPGVRLSTLTAAGGRVFFTDMDNSGYGGQLWISDGTPAGTLKLLEIDPAQMTGNIGNLTAMGDRILFTTRGGSFGDVLRLWKSDGTVEGTAVVREFGQYGFNNPTGLSPVLIAAGSTVYFSAYDELHGDELWKSDGTEAGTVMCADLTGDSGSSTPYNLTLAGNNLFFAATTEAFGLELWKIATETPEISVSGNGVRISPGSMEPNISSFTHFGGTPVDGGNVVRTFTIGNYGSVDLILGGPGITGPEAADFTVSTLSGSPLPPGESTALQITFDPSGPGLRRAVFNIASNDGEENPFAFAISGTGGPAGIEVWRLTHFGTTANSGDAADGADPDFDGIPNLIEWGFGSDPAARSPLAATTTVTSGNIELTAGRSVEALTAGAVFSVKWSDTMTAGTWSSSGVTEQVLSDDGIVRVVRARIPQGSAGRRFVRIHLTAPP